MQALYRHALLAIDLSSNASELLEKSLQFTIQLHAKLSVLHAIEPSPAADHIYVNQAEYKQLIIDGTHKKLKEMGVFDRIAEKDLLVEFGHVKKAILEDAQKHNCELIIVGSNGRHGLQQVLGATANAVLHGANCDVFVMRHQ